MPIYRGAGCSCRGAARAPPGPPPPLITAYRRPVPLSSSGLHRHVDPLNTSAWNTLLRGRKRWALLPPRHRAPHPDALPPQLATELEYFNRSEGFSAEMGWWGTTALWRDASNRSAEEAFRDLRSRWGGEESAGSGLLECEQRPDETLFVPSGWWHTTLNLAPSIAVTE